MELSVELVDGTSTKYEITPLIEYNAEQHFQGGLGPQLAKGRNSDVYWIAWECMRSAGITVPPFGPDFMKLLKSVKEVEEPERPNG